MESMVNGIPDASFWRRRRVLITGHTGFKGSWLSLWLRRMGAQICGIALQPSADKNLYTELRLDRVMENHYVDINNLETLVYTINKFQPEVIIHMAAQALVRESYANPIYTVATNVLGTANVLEAARKVSSVRVIVNVTSDKCYENKEWVWAYRENEALGGDDIYSASKACSEIISNAYNKSFFVHEGLAMATARAGNVIGCGDWSADRLVPDILRSLNENRIVEIRNPQSVRPWQHVLEPLRGYLLLAEKLYLEPEKYVGSWNFGPNQEDCRTVEWIVNEMLTIWGENAGWQLQVGEHPHEALYLRVDNTKARHSLGWQPEISLRDSLIGIIDWYKKYYAGDDVQQLCGTQIDRYVSDLNRRSLH